MKCPKCGTKNIEVVETIDKDDYISRKYNCNDCNFNFISVERILTGKRTTIK